MWLNNLNWGELINGTKFEEIQIFTEKNQNKLNR